MYYDLVFKYYRWNKLFKRNIVLENLKYCDTKISLFEDVNIVFAMMLDVKNVYLLEKPSYNYFVREDSMIRTIFKEKHITNHEYVLKALLNIINDKGMYECLNKLVCQLNSFMIFCLVDSMFDIHGDKKYYLDQVNRSYLLNTEISDIMLSSIGRLKCLMYNALKNKKYGRL